MRILCLNIKKTCNVALADIFLKFSPRVQYRKPNWVFIDITPTVSLFETEERLLDECLNVCHLLSLPVSAAIADTPWGAQVLTEYYDKIIATPGDETSVLSPLPVLALVWLEGLKPWEWPPSTMAQVTSFLQMVGFHTLGDLHPLQKESLQERWGQLGVQIWERLHGLERQVISPWIEEEPLHAYQYLDFPISLLPFLLRSVEKSLVFLFARLQGRSLFAQRLTLTLRCEYSSTSHHIHVTPASASRDLPLFMTLLEQRLAQTDLENPIREFEVDIATCAEKQHQLDFWEPRSSDQEKLQRLISLLQQADCAAGFYQLRNAILPEKTWVREKEPAEFDPIRTEVETQGEAHQVRPAYGQDILRAPRPTRLLNEPKPLRAYEVKKLHILSQHPIERLEDFWWEHGPEERDYYFAVSSKGQCLWIYQDRQTQDYFLHGYFD